MVNGGVNITTFNISKEWESHLKVTQPIKHMLYPTVGNHEKPFYRYFQIYSEFYENASYYSFDKGRMHLIALDTNVPYNPGSPQYEWLVQDFEKNEADWTFVFLHRPVYSPARGTSYGAMRRTILPLFEKYKVDMVFSGHAHTYERSYPIHDNKIDDSGVVYVIAAGGGAPLYDLRENSWTAKMIKSHHFVKIRIKGNTLILNTYNQTNGLIDHYEMVKD